MSGKTCKNIIVSVIIPHYNTPYLLKRLLKTIPIKENLQVIVIDDNSNMFMDEYNEIVDEYSNCVEFYKNSALMRSAGACRNIGISKAKGEWLLFADSDDYFLCDAFDLIFDSIISLQDKDIIFFFPTSEQSWKKSDRTNFYSSLIKEYEGGSYVSELRIRYLFDPPWCKLIKRELIILNGIVFDETSVANDVMFSCKLGLYADKISSLPYEAYCVTENVDSLTSKKTAEKWLERIDVFISKVIYLRKELTSEDYRRLNLNGRKMLLLTIKNGFNLVVLIKVVKKFLNAKIRLI